MDTFAIWGDTFGTIIGGSVDRILPYVEHLAAGFITLALMWVGLDMVQGRGGLASGAIRLSIVGGFIIAMCRWAQSIGEGIMLGAVQFGLLASGRSSLAAERMLESPDSIFVRGYARAADLWEMSNDACSNYFLGIGSCLPYWKTWFPLEVAGWSVLLAFALLALFVMGSSIIFKISILAGILLLPLGVFFPSSRFGWGPIKFAVHSGIQLFVLTIIVSICDLAITAMALPRNFTPGVSTAMPFILAAITIMGLVLSASFLTYRIIDGGLSNIAALGAPAGMAFAGARNAAGHLDGPATAATREIYNRISSASTTTIGQSRLGAIGGRSVSSPASSLAKKTP